jgi:hypothetical protein
MSYFIRFTDNASADLQRGVSYHQTGFPIGCTTGYDIEVSETEWVSNAIGCEQGDIVTYNGVYLQELAGLCAFALDADNVEDAIEEAATFSCGIFDVANDSYCIMSGTAVDTCPEGEVIRGKAVVFINLVK